MNLSVSGFLYYRAIILLDRVLDGDFAFGSVFPLISICEEETVKILSSFFTNDSKYWTVWNKRKLEYLNAYKVDRSHDIHSIDEYETHADEKSSLGKLAIDALFFMGRISDVDTYKTYLKIHRYFYCAFQILDDICEDFKKSQFNIAIWTVENAMKKGDINSDYFKNGESISKAFFTYHYSDDLLKLGSDYLKRAYLLAQEKELSYLSEEICKLWNTIVLQNLNIKAYLYELKVGANLSKDYVHSNSLNDAIYNSIRFLARSQQPNGSWMDFCNNAGTSDTWCTAFVSLMLREANIANGLIRKAIEYLKLSKRKNLWGYSVNWVCDNDSSVICTLATEDYDNISIIEDRFNKDGGLATYNDKNKLLCSLSNVHEWKLEMSGWMQSHLDVSAAALYLFVKSETHNQIVDKLLLFIKYSIRNKKKLVYWWIDDIYFLFFMSKVNKILKDKEIEFFIKTATQKKYEVFLNQKIKSDLTFFYIGMLLHLLLYINDFRKSVIVKDYILKNQYDDGSWSNSSFMCMPAVNDLVPKNTSSWAISDHGIEVRAHEFHRLYTTSVVLMAIKEFEEYDK